MTQFDTANEKSKLLSFMTTWWTNWDGFTYYNIIWKLWRFTSSSSTSVQDFCFDLNLRRFFGGLIQTRIVAYSVAFFLYCCAFYHYPMITSKKKKKTKKKTTSEFETKSVGEQPEDLFRRLQDLPHGFVRVLSHLLANGWPNPEELWRFPLRMLPPAGHQSCSAHPLCRRTGASGRLVRTRPEWRPYVNLPNSPSNRKTLHTFTNINRPSCFTSIPSHLLLISFTPFARNFVFYLSVNSQKESRFHFFHSFFWLTKDCAPFNQHLYIGSLRQAPFSLKFKWVKFLIVSLFRVRHDSTEANGSKAYRRRWWSRLRYLPLAGETTFS